MNFKTIIRGIKTSTAVFLSILISKALNLEYPFFTAIAAIFTIESVKDTPLSAGRIRFLGSFIGALAGIIFSWIEPNNAVLCWVGMMVIIYVCNISGLSNAVAIAGVVFIAIMLSPNMKNTVQYSINRILNTFAGISIAVAVDYIIPIRKEEHS